jgi:hypothetical protein
MGREIRRVPPKWEHPKDEQKSELPYIPMFDRDFETTARKWIEDCIAWDNGTHKDIIADPDRKTRIPYYWQWENPPDEDTCRPKFTEPATWYQVYETVSEGTPITPPFATKEELVEYLVNYGDFWQQHSWENRFKESWYRDARVPGWDREAAVQFVEMEWAPSGVMNSTGYHSPSDAGMYDGLSAPQKEGEE